MVLKTTRPSVMPAALMRPCRISLAKIRGSFRFESRSWNRSRICPGTDLTTLAAGSSTTWFARRTPRLNCSLGSSTGSDTSWGTPAQALTSAASPAALNPAIQRPARRIRRRSLSNFHATRELPAQARQRTLLSWTPAPVPRNQTPARGHASRAARPRLSPFCHTAVQIFVSRRSALGVGALCRQQSGLEQNGGGKRRDERQRHQLAHARGARMVGKPQAAKGCSRRAGAEKDRPGQA